MDLIDDLGTDVAVAILVESRYSGKIEDQRATELIESIRRALGRVRERPEEKEGSQPSLFTAAAGL